jgi:hypothetical protein
MQQRSAHSELNSDALKIPAQRHILRIESAITGETKPGKQSNRAMADAPGGES